MIKRVMPKSILALAALTLIVAGVAYARGGGGGSRSSSGHSSSSHGSSGRFGGGTGHVRGYTRRDGTHVDSYDRSAPGSRSPGSSSSWGSSGGSSGHSSGSTSRSTGSGGSRSSSYASASHWSYSASNYVGQRDSDGRIVRSEAAKHAFMVMTGYPHGRPGYVVDHIVALKRGGADDPSNMQW